MGIGFGQALQYTHTQRYRGRQLGRRVGKQPKIIRRLRRSKLPEFQSLMPCSTFDVEVQSNCSHREECQPEVVTAFDVCYPEARCSSLKTAKGHSQHELIVGS